MEAVLEPVLLFLVLGLLAGLLAGPPWLYRRYRRQGPPGAFVLRWTEADGDPGYRSAEREMTGRLELRRYLGASTKLGFFLGLLGFVWTPLVFAGLVQGMAPMVYIGAPGLLVAWSIFFSSRALLRRGPSEVALVRATAIGEIVLNVWVLAVVALTTVAEHVPRESATREAIASFLGGATSWWPLGGYSVPYALQKGGVGAVVYALVSFTHAGLSLAACRPLAAARSRLAVAAP